MCGIAGCMNAGSPELLASMLKTLAHRGPDGDGMHADGEVAIGMTRLAIIDLVTGDQPMTNEDGTLWLVFNGEIYNYDELRVRLEARGHRFRTRSDTESIVHLFEEDGERCVESLSGMFAFAIWDARRRRLFMARDRLGKKPLYYWRDGRQLVFASEIKALLRHPGVSRALDWDAFHHYLAFGYTPADRSIFAGVRKIPPAHTATFDGADLVLSRYWSLPIVDGGSRAPSLPDLAAQVRRDVREAVRVRLKSDVPLGVFLSGGIDSSVVVASMREVTSDRIATFSIGFGAASPSYDELRYARSVAERFETDHHEDIIDPRVTELLPAIVEHFDEPFADSSAIPTFVVAQATARHVKVALSGVGGDETFGGYPRYLGVRMAETYRRIPRAIRTAARRLVPHVLRESEGSRNLGDWGRRFLSADERPLPEGYIGWTRFFSEPDLARLVAAGVREQWANGVEDRQRAAFATRGHDDIVDGAFRADLESYLPDDLLAMVDRMSMASSLEVRAPFCDHRLIEASLRIPPAIKLRRLTLKGLLKSAFADVLPRDVLSHRKQGFMIPLGQWLRTDLRPLMDALLSPDRVRDRGIFDVAAVDTLRREHRAGMRSHSDRLWTLMMTELWMQHYLDRGGAWRAETRGRGRARPVPLRILTVSDVSPAFPEGGGERMLWEQASRLAARGHEVSVVSRRPLRGMADDVERAGVRITHFPVERASLLRFLRSSIVGARQAVLAEAARRPVDVLHVQQPMAGYGALRSTLGRRLPSLYSFYSPAPLEYLSRRGMTFHHRGGIGGSLGTAVLWAIERACLKRADLIHVLSDFSARQIETLYRIPSERIVKIPAGVDTETFRSIEDREATRQALGLPVDRTLVLSVRNLEHRMGLDLLLRAIALIKRAHPDVLLLIGGAGSRRSELEILARELGLEHEVRFLGFIPEPALPLHYAAADVSVLPTRELEGFGLVTVEALACGTPVLGTPVGATPEILSPLSPSLLFAEASVEAIAQGLGNFLDNRKRDADGYVDLRRACRRHVEDHYGWDRAIGRLEGILARLVRGTAGS